MSRRQGWPYKDDFSCHRCGNCCRGDGFVEITELDLARAARYLQLSESEFIDRYVRRIGESFFLKDQEDPEQSCIFLFQDEKGLSGCRIHGAKPTQCQGFPFAWRPRDAVSYCDGLRALDGLPPSKKRVMA